MIRFRWAVVVSIVAHLGLFSILYLKPSDSHKKGMTYYVDLVNMPGGGDGRPAGGGRGRAAQKGAQAQTGPAPAAKVKDLTVAKSPESDSALRFPDGKEPKKPVQPKPATVKKPVKAEKMVTVVTRRDEQKRPGSETADPGQDGGKDDPYLRIGIGGEGNGNGNGSGDGTGDGTGRGIGFGPGGPGGGYSYYYAAIQNKIKNAWYNTQAARGDSPRVAYIACRILRSGEITDVRVYQGSGDENLDNSGLRAVHRAAPFPPIPMGNPNQYIDVIFEFEGRKR